MAILVVVDAFSKFVFFQPVRTMTSKVTMEVLNEKIFAVAGIPKALVSDNASIFRSAPFKNMCEGLGIKHIFLSPYKPAGSYAERVNRNLKFALSIYHNQCHKNWDVGLSELARAFNGSKHMATGFSPAQLFLGRELSHPLSNAWQLSDDMWDDNPREEQERKWRQAFSNLKKARAIVAARYNEGRKACTFQVGDLVLCKMFPLSSAIKQQSRKLMKGWSKPLRIGLFSSEGSVHLFDRETNEFVRKAHVSHLKRFYERVEE